ncbi:hypothetical protein [Streptosporangium sp. NPDC049644]|uniref:hypothetical protein n=1 Tax=Streptosporangium sp. NPDC049644 TaxID=3155507 RepID=UPI00343BA6BB
MTIRRPPPPEEVGSPATLGIKGSGEPGFIPLSAIEDAEGIRIDRMPISPSELLDLRRAVAG